MLVQVLGQLRHREHQDQVEEEFEGRYLISRAAVAFG
jgi:hypothetical protein